MDQTKINEQEWSTASNWRLGVYKAPLDSRIWVPKRVRWMGWTLNFAHRAAYLWLAVLLAPSLFVLGLCLVAVLRG